MLYLFTWECNYYFIYLILDQTSIEDNITVDQESVNDNGETCTLLQIHFRLLQYQLLKSHRSFNLDWPNKWLLIRKKTNVEFAMSSAEAVYQNHANYSNYSVSSTSSKSSRTFLKITFLA